MTPHSWHEKLVNEIDGALRLPLSPIDRAARCAVIIEDISEPWPGTSRQLEELIDHVLEEVGEEGNGQLRLLLMPAY